MKTENVDQRTRLTKLLIRNNFLELMKQKPVQRITVRELCEKAEINRSTFYSYYLDIYDLLQKIEQEIIDDFGKALSEEIFDWEDYTPVNVCVNVLKVLERNSFLYEFLLGPNGDFGVIEKIADIGKKFFIRVYAYRYPGIDSSILERHYIFISAGAIALVKNWLYVNPEESIEHIGEQIGNLINIYILSLEEIFNRQSGEK